MNNPGFGGKGHNYDQDIHLDKVPQDAIHDPRPEAEGGSGDDTQFCVFSPLFSNQDLEYRHEFHVSWKDTSFFVRATNSSVGYRFRWFFTSQVTLL